MTYSVTWDETKPDDNNYGYEIDNYIRNVLTAVRERLATEHTDVTGSGGLATLMHKHVTTAKASGTTPYTALVTDNVLLITTGATDYTVNLYTAVGNTGKTLKIKKVDSAAGKIIIDGATTETIDGQLTINVFEQYDFVEIMSDGTNWVILNGIDRREYNDVGDIKLTALRTAPVGWLLCRGTAVSRTTYANLFAAIAPEIGDPTISIASPAVVSLTAHGLEIGDAVYFTTDGALPTGITANTIYYIITAGFGADAFEISATKGGSAVNTSGTQSGTHTLTLCPFGLGDGSTTFNLPDFRQRVPMGKAASGTGVNLGESGGTIDHVHTGPSHNHQWYNQNVYGVNDQSYDTDGNLINISLGGTKDVNVYSVIIGTEQSFPGADMFTNKAGTGNTSAGNQLYQTANFIIKY